VIAVDTNILVYARREESPFFIPPLRVALPNSPKALPYGRSLGLVCMSSSPS
jgi:hypothetical protein